MPAPTPSVEPTCQLAMHLSNAFEIVANSAAFQARIAEAHSVPESREGVSQFIHCFDDAITVQDGTLGEPQLDSSLKRPFAIIAPGVEGELSRIASCSFPQFEGQSMTVVLIQDVPQQEDGEHSVDSMMRFLNFAGGTYESVNNRQYAGEVLNCQILTEPGRTSFSEREIPENDFFSFSFGILFGVEASQ